MNNLFLVILKDDQGVPDFLHPTQIFGINKNDIMSVVSADTPQEYIQGIYTTEQYLRFVESEQFRGLLMSYNPDMNPGVVNRVISSIKGYVHGLINMINDSVKQFDDQPVQRAIQQPVSSSQLSDSVEVRQQPVFVQTQQLVVQPQQQVQVKYFTDNGIQFKLVNGQLYKKVWQDVKLTPYTNQNGQQVLPQIRLISLQTMKPVNNSKIGVQQLVWKKIS